MSVMSQRLSRAAEHSKMVHGFGFVLVIMSLVIDTVLQLETCTHDV